MSDQELQLRDTEVAPREKPDQGDLVALAIHQGLDVEKLRALIEMRNAQEEREAKRAFDNHFAEMQAEFDSVHRSKKGYDYKYAPIEVLQKHYGPVIARHGFSYRWREEALPEGTGKRCILRISGWGHAEENFFDVPNITGTKQMNPIQVAGAMSTYGRRYTFIAGFGVIIDDEDPDGVTNMDLGQYSEMVADLEGQDTEERLRDVAKKYREKLKAQGDHNGAAYIMGVYMDCKKALEQ